MIKICTQKFLPRNENILNSLDNNNKLRAALYTSLKWPIYEISVINVYFLNPSDSLTIPRTKYFSSTFKDKNGFILSVDPLQTKIDNENISVIDSIKLIINERYNKFIGLTFNFDNVKPETSHIRISFDKYTGSWSFLGTECLSMGNVNTSTMNFAWFDVATVLHEFGHALGYIHEHQNPDNIPIQWNKPEVYKWAYENYGWDESKTNKNIFDQYNKNNLNSTKFDPKSIMLYFFPSFITLDNKGTTQNLILSSYDVLMLANQYPIDKNTQPDKLLPREFYKKVYNTDIPDFLNESDKGVQVATFRNYGPILIYIIIGLIVFIILFLFILK